MDQREWWKNGFREVGIDRSTDGNTNDDRRTSDFHLGIPASWPASTERGT